jgi:cold-inducible RNA-binding protein
MQGNQGKGGGGDYGSPQAAPNVSKKLFLGGISYDSTEESLRSHFGMYGTIEECTVMMNSMTGQSRGFGFVMYEHAESAESALAQKGNHMVDGKNVDVKRCEPRQSAGGKGGKGGMGKGGGKGGGYGGYGGGGYDQSSQGQVLPPTLRDLQLLPLKLSHIPCVTRNSPQPSSPTPEGAPNSPTMPRNRMNSVFFL